MINDNIHPLPPILICMATYNGEQYLEQQLESLCRQTCQDFLLFVHDDGSTDNTREILKNWEKSNKLNMVILDDDLCFHSSSKNFVINVQISIIRVMKAGWHGMIRILGLNGRSFVENIKEVR